MSALAREKVKLGITPTLWWNDDFPSIDIGITFGQCVSEMALAGFEGCSVGHKYPTDVAELKAALDLRGLRVSEPWVSTYFTIDDMEEQTLANVPQRARLHQGDGRHRTSSSPSSAAPSTRCRSRCSPTGRSSTTPSGTR